ncbi:MAG TPA: DUF1570 domain-containing protein [Polyangia bacterium]
MRCWLLALLLIGCAPVVDRPKFYSVFSLIACPQSGGRRWIELTSPNFTVRTTEPEAMARGDIQAFEDLLVAMKGAIEFVLPAGPNPSRTSLLIFDDDVQFHFIVPQNADGLAVARDDHGRPLIVVETGGSPLVPRHELTHRLVFQRLPRAPVWLNEGLAEYFSMISLKNGIARLGIPTPRLQRLTSSRFEKARVPSKLHVDEIPTLKELLNADEATIESDEKYYIAAWAAVHYLANGGADHVQRFRSFLNAVAKGETAEEALEANYDTLSALEPRYRDYLKKMSAMRPKVREWTFSFPVAPIQANPRVRALDDAEVHRLWGLIVPAYASEQLRQARLHAPLSPITLLMEAEIAARQHRYAEATGELVQAVELAPQDLFLLSLKLSVLLEREAQKPPAERNLALLAADVRRLAETADETQTLAIVARYGALGGDAALALPSAQRAVALDPYCFDCLSSLAQLYFAKGEFALAVDTQELAVHRWPKRGGAPWASLEQLRCYRRRNSGEAVSCPL